MKRIIIAFICLLVIFSIIEITYFNKSTIVNVSAGSSWILTTQEDFENGTSENIFVTSTGEVKLALKTNYVEDNFYNESKIDCKKKCNYRRRCR